MFWIKLGFENNENYKSIHTAYIKKLIPTILKQVKIHQNLRKRIAI